MPDRVLPAYFFPGPEVGNKQKAIESIAGSMDNADGEPPERHRFYPNDTPMADLIALLRNGSLFSAKRLVVLGDVDRLKSAEKKVIVEYLSAPSPDAVLVVSCDSTPGSREYPRDIAGAFPKEAITIYWEMFERDKKGWVVDFLRKRGRRIAGDAVDRLLDVTEGTTVALKEACEVLSFSVAEGGIVTDDDVDKALEHTRTETVYTLFDRFCRRDLSGVLDAYRAMALSDSEGADRFLSRFAGPLSQLQDYLLLAERRVSPEEAFRRLKLRGGKKAQRSYQAATGRYRSAEIARALRRLADTEAWLRTAPQEVRSIRTELWLCRVVGAA